MPARLTWRNLIPGIIALGVVLFLAASVLLFAGVGRVRGAKMNLYVVTSQARGVMRGTEVWLAGQKVGVVDGVTFRPASSDTAQRLVIAMTVRKSEAEQIRRDSRAQVRAGSNIIGPVVVYVYSGTPTSPRARDGDTLRAQSQSDLEVAAVKMKDVTQELGPMMTDARVVMNRVHDPQGTIGALLADGLTQRSDVAELRARMSRLRTTFFGSANAASRSRARLFSRAHDALAEVDSVRTLLASANTSFGRFRRDSTLMRDVARLRDDLGTLRAQLERGDGTLGRLKTDSALTDAVARARAEMATLFTDLQRRPLHYIYF
jgi:phospholipid/cholesterol/gamma-HCH transport system substrate-binding protein